MSERSDWLFLCVANSARSQMAEGIARRLLGESVAVHSAGSDPGTLNPYAVRALAERGIDIASHRSKSTSEIPSERIARVVTLCAEEVCPAFPGEVERIHWPLPDPAAATGPDQAQLEAFRQVRDEIERRLRALIGRP